MSQTKLISHIRNCNVEIHNILYSMERQKPANMSLKLYLSIQDNTQLAKLFEYYAAVKLSRENEEIFYHFDHISKETRKELEWSARDCGVDVSNLVDTIVQCKLYSGYIKWSELSTFIAHQNYSLNGEPVIRYKKMILFRNNESKLSSNIPQQTRKLVTDYTSTRDYFINYILTDYTYYKTGQYKTTICSILDYIKWPIYQIKKIKKNCNILNIRNIRNKHTIRNIVNFLIISNVIVFAPVMGWYNTIRTFAPLIIYILVMAFISNTKYFSK